MKQNLFFRTSLAPYRIDIYNALHKLLKCNFFFYRKVDSSDNYNVDILEAQCNFYSNYLEGYDIGLESRKLCKGIYKILTCYKPEIVIVPEFQIITFQILFYRLFISKKFKIVSMCDDSYDMIHNDNSFTYIHKLARKLVTPFLDDIIVVEPKVRDWYQEHYSKGIWLPIIRDEIKERENYSNVLEISNVLNEEWYLKGQKVLLFVGRFVPLKNLSLLLRAVEAANEDFVTILIGAGECESELKLQSKSMSKRVIFPGYLEGDNLNAWYNISDVFALLSYQEAFGAVTNEALIAGNYAIVSNKAGSHCLVQNDINGYIVNPYDKHEISRRIDELMFKVGCKNEKIVLKPNLMQISFQDTIDNLIRSLSSNTSYGKN